MSNPIITRLNSPNIKDSIPNQGLPLVCLATISLENQPSYYYISGSTNITYDALNTSYQGTTLVFNKYGSLTDKRNYQNPQMGTFFISPFDPAYPNGISPPLVPPDMSDVINGSNNAFVYGLIQNFSTANALPGSTFVSPVNSKWILNVSTDVKGNSVYKIFFNPLQDTSLSATDISNNLKQACDIMSNADPLCFCDTTNTICTAAAVQGTAAANALSANNYNSVNQNCSCLNNQCRFAMANQTNNYVAGMKPCGKLTPACGGTFSYTNAYGVASSDNQSVASVCGVQTTPSPSPNTNSGTNSGTNTGTNPPASSSSLGTSAKVGITIAVILVILVIAYFYIM